MSIKYKKQQPNDHSDGEKSNFFKSSLHNDSRSVEYTRFKNKKASEGFSEEDSLYQEDSAFIPFSLMNRARMTTTTKFKLPKKFPFKSMDRTSYNQSL